MSIGSLIRAWRLSKKQSLEWLSDTAGISAALLEQIELEQTDPSTATIEALATALRIPPAWLFDTPQSFDCLFKDSDEQEEPAPSQVDPVTDRILAGSRMDRSLYVLLTALMQAGDPKLLRAVEEVLFASYEPSHER
jgi:transcriptional regulator with XRE-family HTH domain